MNASTGTASCRARENGGEEATLHSNSRSQASETRTRLSPERWKIGGKTRVWHARYPILIYVPIYRNTVIVMEIYVGTLAGVENLQIDTVTRQ